MTEGEVPTVEPVPVPDVKTTWPWIELLKVLALPLVTLVLGYWFNASLNERQQIDNNIRLYAEMMGRREEADSNLRKDMFNSILTTFMSEDPGAKITDEEEIRQQILSLELLAYNFHESLDIGPLFKDVERRIRLSAKGTDQELQRRLESVALQVIEHRAEGDPGCLADIRVEAGRREGRACDREWLAVGAELRAGDRLALAQVEAQGHVGVDLDAGAGHFAVAHREVDIAG